MKKVKKIIKGTIKNMMEEPKFYAKKIKKAYKNLPSNIRGLSKY